MSEKPTLQDIAAMPFPASLHAMREHYNPNWGMPLPEDDGDGDLRTYSVRIEYSFTEYDSRTYTVQARSKEGAEKLAEEMFDKDVTVEENAELSDVDVSEESDA